MRRVMRCAHGERGSIVTQAATMSTCVNIAKPCRGPVACVRRRHDRAPSTAQHRNCVSEIEIHMSKQPRSAHPCERAARQAQTGHGFNLVQNKNNFKRDNPQANALSR